MTFIGPRGIKLAINGTDYSAEVSDATIVSGDDSDGFLSFVAARTGGLRAYKLRMTVPQDASTGTLWDLIWEHAGEDVEFYLAPYGNTTATDDQPHYTGNVVVAEPDGDWLGGKSSKSTTAVLTVDLSWDVTGRPAKVTSGDFPGTGEG